MGRNSYNLKCQRCNISFTGFAHNREHCDVCRQMGRDAICKNCGGVFLTKTYGVHCPTCLKDRVWLRHPHSKTRRLNIAKGKVSWCSSPEGRDFYKQLGKSNSIHMLAYHKTQRGLEQRERNSKKQSLMMQRKIANGDFTPHITNSFTHWSAVIHLENGTTRKFRSSWEACVWNCNKEWQYEVLRVPLTTGRTAIPDFVHDSNVYEIKPKSQWHKQQQKMDEVIHYCISNGLRFIWINEDNILDFVDEGMFSLKNRPQYEKMINGIT